MVMPLLSFVSVSCKKENGIHNGVLQAIPPEMMVKSAVDATQTLFQRNQSSVGQFFNILADKIPYSPVYYDIIT
jgi:hypothetical protein